MSPIAICLTHLHSNVLLLFHKNMRRYVTKTFADASKLLARIKRSDKHLEEFISRQIAEPELPPPNRVELMMKRCDEVKGDVKDFKTKLTMMQKFTAKM